MPRKPERCQCQRSMCVVCEDLRRRRERYVKRKSSGPRKYTKPVGPRRSYKPDEELDKQAQNWLSGLESTDIFERTLGGVVMYA